MNKEDCNLDNLYVYLHNGRYKGCYEGRYQELNKKHNVIKKVRKWYRINKDTGKEPPRWWGDKELEILEQLKEEA